jgi:hypothetical protein
MEKISIPKDRQIWNSEIATYWFEDGILIGLSKNTLRTVDVIRRNVELIKQLTNNKPVPYLIYLSKSPVPDKATRKYSTEQLPVIYKAMAMVSKPGLALFIMKLLFKLKPSPIPMESFIDDKKAKEWLMQFV